MADVITKKSENAAAELSMFLQNLVAGVVDYFKSIQQMKEAREAYRISMTNVSLEEQTDLLRALIEENVKDEAVKKEFIEEIDRMVAHNTPVREGLTEINNIIQDSSLDIETKQHMDNSIKEIWQTNSGMCAVSVAKEAWPQVRSILAQKKGYNPYSYSVIPTNDGRQLITFPSIYKDDVQNAIDQAGLCLGNIKNCTSRRDMEIVACGSALESGKATMMTFHGLPQELAMKAVNESDHISQFAFGMEPSMKQKGTFDLFCIGGENGPEKQVARTYATTILWKASLALNGPLGVNEAKHMREMIGQNRKIAEAIESLRDPKSEDTQYYVYQIPNGLDFDGGRIEPDPDNYIMFNKNAMTEYERGKAVSSTYNSHKDYAHIVNAKLGNVQDGSDRIIITQTERDSVLKDAATIMNYYETLQTECPTKQQAMSRVETRMAELANVVTNKDKEFSQATVNAARREQTAISSLYGMLLTGQPISQENIERSVMKEYLAGKRFRPDQILDPALSTAYQKYCNYMIGNVAKYNIIEKGGGHEVHTLDMAEDRKNGGQSNQEQKSFAQLMQMSGDGFRLSSYGSPEMVKQYAEKVSAAIKACKGDNEAPVHKMGFKDIAEASQILQTVSKSTNIFTKYFQDAEKTLNTPIRTKSMGEKEHAKPITVTAERLNLPFDLRSNEYPYMQAAKMHINMENELFQKASKQNQEPNRGHNFETPERPEPDRDR